MESNQNKRFFLGYESKDKANNKNEFKEFQCVKTLENNNWVNYITELSSGKIAASCFNHTINIWNKETGLRESNFQEESNIWSLLEFVPNILLCGCSNGKIKAWDLNKPEVIKTFIYHSDCVWSLVKIDKKYFTSCSGDGCTNIWNYDINTCVSSFNFKEGGIIALIKLKSGLLCSGGDAKIIRIWDWKKNMDKDKKIIRTNHKVSIRCLCELSDGTILSGSWDKTIKVWKDEQCLATLSEYNDGIYSLCEINLNYFASSCYDRTIKIWRKKDLKCVQVLEEHQNSVFCIIKTHDGFLVSGSNDKTVKIFCIKQ